MEPIIPRAQIAQQADAAARAYAANPGQDRPANPHAFASDAAAAWNASFERQLLWHTAPEAEGSA